MDLPFTPTQALTRGFTHEVAPANAPRFVATARADHARQGFRVGGVCAMVRYEDGSELTDMPALYRLPQAAPWFRGIANLHGMLIPVFDLARFAGLDGTGAAKPMLLVLSHGADAAGVVIDGLPQRLRWTSEEAADPDTAPAALAPHVRAAAWIGGELWFDLDCASLLDALERSLSPTPLTGA